MIGHSFGAHTVINMAALNATGTESKSVAKEALAIRGLALIAPAGCVPHQSLHLGAISLMLKLLKSGNSWAVSAATHVTKFVYTKVLRFPSSDSSADPFVSAVVRAGTTNFDLIRDQAKLLERLRLPTFIAWAKDDEHIQPEIPTELCKLCSVGPRLEFSGHNLQKTRADQIATAMTKWIDDVITKTSV